jgi:hypothetical protein
VLREYGFPRECRNFVEQKDSAAYYACCRKYEACWVVFYDENNKRTIKQLEYEIILRDSSYLKKTNFERSVERAYKRIDSLELEYKSKRKTKNVSE